MKWGDEDAQIVQLPFRCRGKIKKSWHYYSTGEIVKGHNQYVAILTCRVEAWEQRTEREKKGRVSIYDNGDLGMNAEESDSDASQGGGG